MFVNDPSELALLPEVEEDGLYAEPARDYHEFFNDDRPMPGQRHTGWNPPIQTQICRFNQYNEHTTMAEDCPHFNPSDEEGRIIRKGWTVQSG
jgi:hypothetical protein